MFLFPIYHVLTGLFINYNGASFSSFCILYFIQGALIASRINSILGIALDFYNIQQTLGSGGAVSAIKARCEMEVDRIEKQFDDCIAFLLRVFFYRIYFNYVAASSTWS